MALNLLQIVTKMCLRQGLTVPSVVTTSTDTQVRQLWEFANEILDDLVARMNWTGTTQEASFMGTGVYLQGSMSTIAPNGFQWIKKDTFWCRTTRLPILGPMSPEEWQEALAVPFAGPWYRYRLEQGNMMMYPAAPVTNQYFFEYASNWPAKSAGGALQQYFNADTDTCMFPDALVLLGIRWKWRAEKGLPYLEHMRAYEAAVNDINGNDGSKKTVSMSGEASGFRPAILVPAGNWSVP